MTWNVAEETRALLVTLAPEAARRGVVFEMAVAPEFSLHADRDTWRQVLLLLARHAARQAEERVLISARGLGGRVQIAVSDDGQGPAVAMQQAQLRPAAELAALQGGTLEVTVQPGEGSILALLLPATPREGRRAGQASPQFTGQPYAAPMTAAVGAATADDVVV